MVKNKWGTKAGDKKKAEQEFFIIDDFDPKISANFEWGNLIWHQINRILILRSTLRWIEFIEAVDGLEDTIDYYKYKQFNAKWDDHLPNIKAKHDALPSGERKAKQRGHDVYYAKEKYKMLCHLMGSIGIFPMKSLK